MENALDPSVVIVVGVGATMLSSAAAAFTEAYRGGLMRHRRAAPPAVRAGRFVDGRLRGAAEIAFDAILEPEPLAG